MKKKKKQEGEPGRMSQAELTERRRVAVQKALRAAQTAEPGMSYDEWRHARDVEQQEQSRGKDHAG